MTKHDDECETCGDSREVAHPLWGTRYCPEETAPCPDCCGTDRGEYLIELVESERM